MSIRTNRNLDAYQFTVRPLSKEEGGGYLVLEHLAKILGGPVVWAPAVQGAVVVSQRGGDFELTVGQDFSLGYDATVGGSVHLYLEESLVFRVVAPEASVVLTHR